MSIIFMQDSYHFFSPIPCHAILFILHTVPQFVLHLYVSQLVGQSVGQGTDVDDKQRYNPS